MHGSGVPRPSSAPRRRYVEPRKELLKQSSVPNLAQVPDRLGDGNARARRSAQVQAAYDPRAMRRAASATTLGARPERREDYASRMAAGRPLGRYDSSMFHPSEPVGAVGRQGMGGFPKADALQLESRLTQRLREHSFNSMEPTRRPSRRKGQGGQVLLGGAPFEYRERDRLSASLQGRSPMYRSASTAWPEGDLRVPSGSFSNFGTPNRRPLHSTTSSPYQPSTYSQFGGATESGESSLKIYSDLFEEVIERDRVFGPLLRKVKSAYDSMLHQEVSTFAPLDGTAGSLRASRSSEPTMRAEVTTSEPWELHRENQALKDLIERLHMELEEAVKREQRWKTKAAKLKARFSSPMTQAVHQHQGLQGWMPVDQGYPDWACHEGDVMNLPGARSSAAFQANRREPVSEVQAADLLNQAHLMSLSSISPQHSQLQRSMMEPLDHGSARSEDSGILPQRPERRVLRPASVPKLDLTKMQELEEEYSQAEGDPDEEQQYEQYEQYAPGEYPEEGLDDESGSGERPPSEDAA